MNPACGFSSYDEPCQSERCLRRTWAKRAPLAISMTMVIPDIAQTFLLTHEAGRGIVFLFPSGL